ncbi:hypothetical protein [Polaribacter sp.]|uniref:hypothetical protein n=1 Tax=Polaribacter sp. TaxID=1920175 RepID=UPI003F6C5B0D
MKIGKLSLLMVLVITLFASCNINDNSTQTETLNGNWNLKNVSGGLQGINIDYSEGEVEWNFNLENNTLTIENNIITTGPKDIYAGLDSGTYNIEIKQNGNTEILFINDTERRVIILLNSNLKIDDGIAADGFITEFQR